MGQCTGKLSKPADLLLSCLQGICICLIPFSHFINAILLIIKKISIFFALPLVFSQKLHIINE